MLAGSLTEFSLPDVFSLLAATRKTGVLHLSCPQAHGRVWVLGGALAYAAADITRTPLVARLLHGGEIETAAVEPLVGAQASGDGTEMSKALAAAGIATDRVAQLLHDQTIDAVFDLSRWTEGQFAFEADLAPGAAATAGGAPTVAAPEVLEAVGARITEWDGIVSQLPSPASVLSSVSRPPLHAGGVVQMTAAQWEVFTLVDGVRSVNDLIALTGQGQFVVARLLAGLVAEGLVAVRQDAGAETLSQQRARHLAQVEHQVLGAIAPVEIPPVRVPPAPAGRRPQRDAARKSPDGRQVDVTDAASPTDPEAGLDMASLLRQDDADVPTTLDADPAQAAAAARRKREMVAMGLAASEEPTADTSAAAEPTAEGRNLGSDLIARLIDGVKGA